MARSLFSSCSVAVKRFAVLLACWLLTGCSALQLDPSATDLALTASTDTKAAQAVAPSQVVKVQIRAAGRSPEVQEISWREGMFIGDALDETGLTRRFRRMDLHLLRYNAHGLAKMDSRYEHKLAKVHPRFDYALHPGDHLVVTEDTTTVLHDMLNSLVPFAGPASR
jgi:hypothetical protein